MPRVWCLFLFYFVILLALPGTTFGGRPIRFLLPPAPFSAEGDKELLNLVERYNKVHPENPVELLQRGENFSSLKDLITLSLASDPPEIAAIEISEFPAVQSLNLAKAVRIKTLKTTPGQRLFPFRLTVPLLIADQEMLYRGHANPDHLPSQWKTVISLAQSLANTLQTTSPQALSVPLQGPTGLWFFEAILGKPLWTSGNETPLKPGLKMDSELPHAIEEIQRLIDTPFLLKAEENPERAAQLFLDRKSPLLITSLDMLPYLTRHATFRWRAAPLPHRMGKNSLLQTGNGLVVTRDSPEVIRFLEYLYDPVHAIPWTVQGSFLPLDPQWLGQPAWKQATRSREVYQNSVVQLLRSKENRAHAGLTQRATCPEIIRNRSEWVQALRLFFGDPSHRVSSERILQQLETSLNNSKGRR